MRKVRVGDEVRLVVKDHHAGSDTLSTAVIRGVVSAIFPDWIVLDWWTTDHMQERNPGGNCEPVSIVRKAIEYGELMVPSGKLRF